MRLITTLKQTGAASIEFPLVFILLFFLFYGLAGYSIPLLLGASYQEIAADSLRHAVELHARSGDRPDFQARVTELVERSWLSAAWVGTCPGYGDGFLDAGAEEWRICLRLENPESLIPPFRIFGWQVPQLPAEIRGEAAMRLR